MGTSASDNEGFSWKQLLLGFFTALLLGPVVILALVPLALVVVLLWPLLLLPVLAGGSLDAPTNSQSLGLANASAG